MPGIETTTASESRSAPLVIRGRHKSHLQTVRDLIDDIDGVAFGRLSSLLDDLAVEADRALMEREELLEALEQAQSVLAMFIDPKAIERTTTLNAYAQAVEAETRARAIIAKATGAI